MCRFDSACLCNVRIKSSAQLWSGSLPLISWWRDHWVQGWLTWNCQKKWNSGLKKSSTMCSFESLSLLFYVILLLPLYGFFTLLTSLFLHISSSNCLLGISIHFFLLAFYKTVSQLKGFCLCFFYLYWLLFFVWVLTVKQSTWVYDLLSYTFI